MEGIGKKWWEINYLINKIFEMHTMHFFSLHRHMSCWKLIVTSFSSDHRFDSGVLIIFMCWFLSQWTKIDWAVSKSKDVANQCKNRPCTARRILFCVQSIYLKVLSMALFCFMCFLYHSLCDLVHTFCYKRNSTAHQPIGVQTKKRLDWHL